MRCIRVKRIETLFDKYVGHSFRIPCASQNLWGFEKEDWFEYQEKPVIRE